MLRKLFVTAATVAAISPLFAQDSQPRQKKNQSQLRYRDLLMSYYRYDFSPRILLITEQALPTAIIPLNWVWLPLNWNIPWVKLDL